MKTLEIIRALLRVMLFFIVTSLVIMGAGITDVRGDLGTQFGLIACFVLMGLATWWAHGVIHAMYHAELTREFYRRSKNTEFTFLNKDEF
jgi:hypothetical protein